MTITSKEDQLFCTMKDGWKALPTLSGIVMAHPDHPALHIPWGSISMGDTIPRESDFEKYRIEPK